MRKGAFLLLAVIVVAVAGLRYPFLPSGDFQSVLYVVPDNFYSPSLETIGAMGLLAVLTAAGLVYLIYRRRKNRRSVGGQ